jgi:hypothetical protein
VGSETHARSQLKGPRTTGTEHLIYAVRCLSETGAKQVAAASGEVRDIENIKGLANQNEMKPFCDAAIPAEPKVVGQERISKLEICR